jgi:hypothetical protein
VLAFSTNVAAVHCGRAPNSSTARSVAKLKELLVVDAS